jgi:hypothetical protein
MPGPVQPWDQPEDPRDQTVDLPRIDLAGFGNGRAASDSGSSGITRPSFYPPDPPRPAAAPRPEPPPEPVPAEPPLAPLPPARREPPEPLPRRLPDTSRDPYARLGQPTQPGALFRPAEPDAGRRPDREPFRSAEPPAGREPDTAQYRTAVPAAGREPDSALFRPAPESGDPGRPAAPPPAGPVVDTEPPDEHSGAPSAGERFTEPPVTSAPDPLGPDAALGATPRDPAQAPAAAVRRRTAPAPAAGRPAPGSIRDLLGRLDRLPDGHPSSPYEDGGLARPLPHRLRQLELGLPAPEREPADLGSPPTGAAPPRAGTPPAARASGGSAGQDPYAAPATVTNGHGDPGHRPPTDRELALGPWPGTGAEPGGRNGLDRAAAAQGRTDQEQLVAGLLAAYRVAEGRNAHGEYGESGLTPAMRRIAHQLPRGGLARGSEDDTLKPAERLAAKLARLIARHPGRSPEELAAGIGDGVRYAFTFDPDYYTEGTWLVHRKLKAYGFELEARRNRWDSPEYKGVWTRWRDPAHGLVFEVQFHTGHSWDLLKRTHAAYVQITDPATPAAERARLRARQVAAITSAKAPPNCTEIADFGREAR